MFHEEDDVECRRIVWLFFLSACPEYVRHYCAPFIFTRQNVIFNVSIFFLCLRLPGLDFVRKSGTPPPSQSSAYMDTIADIDTPCPCMLYGFDRLRDTGSAIQNIYTFHASTSFNHPDDFQIFPYCCQVGKAFLIEKSIPCVSATEPANTINNNNNTINPPTNGNCTNCLHVSFFLLLCVSRFIQLIYRREKKIQCRHLC